MSKFKNIRIKKPGGGSRLQRVQVLASGKYKFVKNKLSRSSKKTKTSKKTTRRVRKTARRKRRRGSGGFTIPLAPVIGLAAGMIGPIDRLIAGDAKAAVNEVAYNYLGMANVGYTTPKFDPKGMLNGLVPLALGLLVHKFVGGPPLNANRMLARAKVPLIRI